MENETVKKPDVLDLIIGTVCRWIGVIGTLLSLIAYVIVIYILTLPASEYSKDPKDLIWFAVLNAGVGLMVAIFLAIQGSIFSINKHKDLYLKFHTKKIKESKKRATEAGIWTKFTIKTVFTRIATFAFTTFATWEFMTMAGEDPKLLGLAFANLGVFLSSGMLALNSIYNTFEKKLMPSYQAKLDESQGEEKHD